MHESHIYLNIKFITMISLYQRINEAFKNDMSEILNETRIKPEPLSNAKSIMQKAGFKDRIDYSDDGKNLYIRDLSIATELENSQDLIVMTDEQVNTKHPAHIYRIEIMQP